MMVDRIRKWFMPTFLAFIFSQPPNTVTVSAKELALMSEWREALLTRPLEEDLTADSISKAVGLIPASCEQIRQWKTNQLLDLVRKSKTYEGQEVTEDVPSLASTIFRCGNCRRSYTHPIGLIHVCNYDPHTSTFPEVFEEITNQDDTKNPESAPRVKRLARRLAQGQERLITKAFKRDRLRSQDWDGLRETIFDDAAHDHMVNLLEVLGYDRCTLAIDMQNKQIDVDVLCPCYTRPDVVTSEEDDPPRWATHWLDAVRSEPF